MLLDFLVFFSSAIQRRGDFHRPIGARHWTNNRSHWMRVRRAGGDGGLQVLTLDYSDKCAFSAQLSAPREQASNRAAARALSDASRAGGTRRATRSFNSIKAATNENHLEDSSAQKWDRFVEKQTEWRAFVRIKSEARVPQVRALERPSPTRAPPARKPGCSSPAPIWPNASRRRCPARLSSAPSPCPSATSS